MLAILLLAPAILAAQGRISNAKTESRSAAQGLEREVNAVVARVDAGWIGYSVPMVAGHREMCCYDTISDSGACCGRCRLDGGSGVTMDQGDRTSGSRVMLEAPTEFLVLARVDHGRIVRVRTFTPDCDIDGGGMPLTWLNDVRPDESVAWLSALVASAGDDSERRERVTKPGIAAIALHNASAADRALESFVAESQPEWLRSDTTFWLGTARGESGVRVLTRMTAQDPSDKVRDKAVFGLSVSKQPSALKTLIDAARNDQSARVRGQALFWLAHKAGQQAVATITDAIDRDPETEVKKKAVFALSQLPKDEGVPKLIEVARTNKNPAVRKQAIFWLGQSHDPRALKFFEEILTAK
jgi:hypothetical protein